MRGAGELPCGKRSVAIGAQKLDVYVCPSEMIPGVDRSPVTWAVAVASRGCSEKFSLSVEQDDLKVCSGNGRVCEPLASRKDLEQMCFDDNRCDVFIAAKTCSGAIGDGLLKGADAVWFKPFRVHAGNDVIRQPVTPIDCGPGSSINDRSGPFTALLNFFLKFSD